jgi:hypothetical protein
LPTLTDASFVGTGIHKQFTETNRIIMKSSFVQVAEAPYPFVLPENTRGSSAGDTVLAG